MSSDRPDDAPASGPPEAAPNTDSDSGSTPCDEVTPDPVFDVADTEPTPTGRNGAFQIGVGTKKSLKRRREDTKSYLALALVVIVGLVMIGGWWGWLQGHDLKDFGTFAGPLFTLAAAALAFYDRGRGQ